MSSLSPLTLAWFRTTKWLTQAGLGTCLLILGACVAPPNTTGPEASPEIFSASPTAQSETLPEDQLPSELVGTFDLSQEACESFSMTRLTVMQDKLDFYYGFANIDSVTVRDGGYDIDATLFHQEGQVEVRPEAVTYRIQPGNQAESIQFENPWAGGETSSMVRCAETSNQPVTESNVNAAANQGAVSPYALQ